MIDVFRAKALDILGSLLLVKGYTFHTDWSPPYSHKDSLFFSKVIDGSLTVVCAINHRTTSDKTTISGQFAIEIGRERVAGIYALFNGSSNEAMHGYVPIPPASPIPLLPTSVFGEEYTWHFSTEEELTRLLTAAHIRLDGVVLSWVESLTTSLYVSEPKKSGIESRFGNLLKVNGMQKQPIKHCRSIF